MDVSGWTVDQRARLPDWCFGNSEAIGCQVCCEVADNTFWGISEIELPDPACIWSMAWWFRQNAYCNHMFRFGLAEEVPVNVGQMDAATEILPYVGKPATGPNELRQGTAESNIQQLFLRRCMATGGLKLVVQLGSSVQWATIDLIIIVSGLPTSMAGWLAHHRV